jgi:hypothetical protein
MYNRRAGPKLPLNQHLAGASAATLFASDLRKLP